MPFFADGVSAGKVPVSTLLSVSAAEMFLSCLADPVFWELFSALPDDVVADVLFDDTEVPVIVISPEAV